MQGRAVLSVFKEHPIDSGVTFFEAGKNRCRRDTEPICTKIEYHQPQGEGDQHYCEAFLDNGRIERIFRPDVIVFQDLENPPFSL